MAGALPRVTDGTFDEVAGPGSGTVVLQFSTPGCVPCRSLGRVLRSLRAHLPDEVSVLEVEAVENPGLVARFEVSGTPTLVILRDGRERERRIGVDRPQALRKAILDHHDDQDDS
jgi:thioredoxin 1